MLRRILHKLVKPTRLQTLIARTQIQPLKPRPILPLIIVARNTIQPRRPQQQMPSIVNHRLLLTGRLRQLHLRHHIHLCQKLRQTIQGLPSKLRHPHLHIWPHLHSIIKHLIHPLRLQLPTHQSQRRRHPPLISQALLRRMKKRLQPLLHSSILTPHMTRDTIHLRHMHLHPVRIRQHHRLLKILPNRPLLLLIQIIIHRLPSHTPLPKIHLTQLRPLCCLRLPHLMTRHTIKLLKIRLPHLHLILRRLTRHLPDPS